MDWCISMEHLMTLLTVLLQIAQGFSIRGHSEYNEDHQRQGQQWSPADMDRIRQLANRMQQFPSAFPEQQKQHQDDDRIIKSYHMKKSRSRMQSPEDEDPTSILYDNAQTSIASAARLRKGDNYKSSGLNRYLSGNEFDDITNINNNFGNDDIMLSSDDLINNGGGTGEEEEVEDNNGNGFVEDDDDDDDGVDSSIRDSGFNKMLLASSRTPSSSSSLPSSYSSHQSNAIVANIDDDFTSPLRSFEDHQSGRLRHTSPSKRQQGWYVQYGKRASGATKSQSERLDEDDNNNNNNINDNFAYDNNLNPNSNYNNFFDGFQQAKPAVTSMMQKIMTTRFLNTKSADDDDNNIINNNNHKINTFKSKHNNILSGEGKPHKASSLALNLELRKSIQQLKKLEKDLKISTLAYDVVKRFIEDPPAGVPRLQDKAPVKRQQGWFTQYGKRSREQIPLSIS